jgi:hypothetical protein
MLQDGRGLPFLMLLSVHTRCCSSARYAGAPRQQQWECGCSQRRSFFEEGEQRLQDSQWLSGLLRVLSKEWLLEAVERRLQHSKLLNR